LCSAVSHEPLKNAIDPSQTVKFFFIHPLIDLASHFNTKARDMPSEKDRLNLTVPPVNDAVFNPVDVLLWDITNNKQLLNIKKI
jgi:hypothetical protein